MKLVPRVRWCGQKKSQTAFLALVPISARLANAHLKRATANLFVVAVYAPALDAGEEEKNSAFYAQIFYAMFYQDAFDVHPNVHWLCP